MLNLVPLQGEQIQASSFPIDTPVYICECDPTTATRNPAAAHIVSSGIVTSVWLQMGRPGNLELLYKVKISNDWNTNSTTSSYIKPQENELLIRESRLRFRNGCPVYVQVDDIGYIGGEKHGEIREMEGIVLGFYDIPKDDDRRPYCNHSFWYVVEICGKMDEGEEGGCSSSSSAGKRIYYNVSPSELRFRSCQREKKKREIENITKDNYCQDFKIEVNRNDEKEEETGGSNEEETGGGYEEEGDGGKNEPESITRANLETSSMVEPTVGILIPDDENASSRVNDDASCQVPKNEQVHVISQSIEYSSLDNTTSSPQRDGKYSPVGIKGVEISIKTEDLQIPLLGEVPTIDHDLATNTQISLEDKEEESVIWSLMNRNTIGSKRAHDDEHREDSSTVVNASHLKIRRVDAHVEDQDCDSKNGGDCEMRAPLISSDVNSSLSPLSNTCEGVITNDVVKVEECKIADTRENLKPSLQPNGQHQALGGNACVKHEKSKNGDRQRDLQVDKGVADTRENLAMMETSSQPNFKQNSLNSSTQDVNSSKKFEEITKLVSNQSMTSEGSQHLNCWIASDRSDVVHSFRKPPKTFQFVSVQSVPISSTYINGALIGHRGKKRETLMKTIKCWYAIANSSDMQRIEIHGDTKAQVEVGTQFMCNELLQWLRENAQGQVDVKQIVQNTIVKYYVLRQQSNINIRSSAKADRLYARRFLCHSPETKLEQEGTLQIILPPIEKSTLYRVVIGPRGETHKRLLDATNATSIKVTYSDKGSRIVVRSYSTLSARKACAFILDDIQREVGRLPGAKIC